MQENSKEKNIKIQQKRKDKFQFILQKMKFLILIKCMIKNISQQELLI